MPPLRTVARLLLPPRTAVPRRAGGWRAALVALSCGLAGAALGGCASLPPSGPKRISQAWSTPQDTALGRQVAGAQPGPALSGFRIVVSGTDALAVLIALADKAERTLDLQYYLVHNEPSTRALLQHVRAAADRGVRVRLLVDDMHTAGNDAAFRRLTEHPRIEVRLYNPLPVARFSTLTKVVGSLTDVARINRRMHNKMFVADNALAFMGGRNLGDAYFLQSDTANFVDLDVMAAGPAVRALSASFDRYWNSDLAFPIAAFLPEAPPPAAAASAAAPRGELDAPPPPDTAASAVAAAAALDLGSAGLKRLQWARARLLADPPEKIETPALADDDALMFDDVLALLRSAKREVLVVSPYLVPGERGLAVFRDLRARGVRVRVLTSSLASTDAPVVHIGYARYRERMVQMGIELLELRPRIGNEARLGTFGQSEARLHAKALAVDGRHVVVGSMNLDRRSMDLNSELGLQINSPAMAADLARLYEELAASSYRVSFDAQGKLQWSGRDAHGQPVTLQREPEATLWRWLSWRLLAPFAPEEML